MTGIAVGIALFGFVVGTVGCLLMARHNSPFARGIVAFGVALSFIGSALVMIAGAWPR